MAKRRNKDAVPAAEIQNVLALFRFIGFAVDPDF
jgi:hypothetical protein